MSEPFLAALASGSQPTVKCHVGQFLRSLDDDERDAVLTALRRCRSESPDDSGFTFSWLATVLEENNKGSLKPPSLRRHMRGECNCDGSTR